MLPARVLALLRSWQERDLRLDREFPGFVEVGEILEIWQTLVGTRERFLESLLAELRGMGLIETFDSHIARLDAGSRIQITLCGKLQLDWTSEELTYVRMTGEVDPLVDPDKKRTLRTIHDNFLKSIRDNENWHHTNQIEKNFAALYVTYLLEQVGKASPLPSRSETIPLQDFEKRLREAWQIMPQA